jgi:hypothetical protein
MHEQSSTQTPAVPRSIIRGRKHNNSNTNIQQWPQLPLLQQQHQTTTSTSTSTNHVDERTVMSNLSPDDSTKTMMTSVSRMVETLGTVVSTLAKENSNLAKETANTNDTIKQMMIQQTATMNNFMMLITRNEERQQGIPNRVVQQMSTPSSTITNSQFSLSQQSPSANNRKCDGIADNETTAISIVVHGPENMAADEESDEMIEDQTDGTAEQQIDQRELKDATMEDNQQITTNQQQQQKQQAMITTTNTINTTVAAGDFRHQFNLKPSNEHTSSSTSNGANQQ